MKEYFKKRAVRFIVMVYIFYTFFTPGEMVFATDVPGGSKAPLSENAAVSEDDQKEPVSADASDEVPGMPETASNAEVPDTAGSVLNCEENAASGDENSPRLSSMLITLYRYDLPTGIHTVRQYGDLRKYRYDAKTDREVPFSEKQIADFKEITGKVSESMIEFYPENRNVEFELEQLDPETGAVISTTGRTSTSSYRFNIYGLFRMHLYPLYDVISADDEDVMYYFYSTGIDNVPPTAEVSLEFNGEGINDRNGKRRYAGGKITVTGRDEHTALNTMPYMMDYPDGEWSSVNTLDKLTSKVYMVAVRDIKNNIRVVSVDATSVDDKAPEIAEARIESDNLFNGYAVSENINIIAEDDTELAGRYYSTDQKEWLGESVITVTCNGSYEFYLRDVFKNTAKRTLEVDNIDKEAPETYYSDDPGQVINGYSGSHTLKINARDEKAGLPAKAWSYDGGKTWTDTGSLVVSENGTYGLCARDGLGNMSTVCSMDVRNIDNTPPEILSVSENRHNEAGIYASDVQITVSARDAQSGLAGDHVSFDNGETWTKNTVKQIEKNGMYHIKVRDGVGNTAENTIHIGNIDSESPQCEITGNPTNLTKNKVVLKLALRDELSGLKSVCVENNKAGVKKTIRDYDRNEKGTGKNMDSVDVDITSNGEYVFTFTDMCGNTGTEKVVVSKIIKASATQPENPGTDDPGTGGKDPGKTPEKKDNGDDAGQKTVVIGKGSTNTGQNTSKDSTITVKGGDRATTTETEGGTVKITASSNKYLSGTASGTQSGNEDEVSDNALEDEEDEELYEPDPEDFSSEFYDTELPEYRASNEPKQMEALPNPDEADVTETERSHAGIIACTAFAIVLGLSALTVFLLIKKGIIKKPDFLGGTDESE